MGFLDRLFGRYRHHEINGAAFYPLQSANVFAKLQYLEAFNEIPELNAVINKRAKARAQGNYNVVNDKGEVLHDHWLQKLIKNPNWFQAEKEFIRQSCLFRDIFGNEFLYNLTPVGLSKPERTSALFTLPPQLMDLDYKSNLLFFLTKTAPEIKYTTTTKGGEVEVDKDNLIHLNDNRVNIKDPADKSVLKGESKMEGLKPALNNIRLAYESRGIILKYRGALGILSNQSQDAGGTIALDEKERETLQQQYKQYGGLHGQHQLIISNANLKWQQMNVNPDKLGLFDETSADFDKILDSYDTPSELFVRKAGSTYENQKEARKGFIQDTVWPDGIEWCGAINRKYLLDDPKAKLTVDYSHLSIFQEDLKNRSDAMNTLIQALSKALADQVITLEEYQYELKTKFNIGTSKKQ